MNMIPPPVHWKLDGFIYWLGKSLVKTGYKMPLSHHVQKVPDYNKCVLANGAPLKFHPDFPDMQHLDKSVLGLKDYFLVHDWIRSPVFYLASLYNGYENTPMVSDYATLKWNRPLYKLSYDDSLPRVSHKLWPNRHFADGYVAMLEKTGLKPLLKEAKAFKFDQALKTIDILSQNPDKPLTRNAIDQLGDLEQMRMKFQNMLEQIMETR